MTLSFKQLRDYYNQCDPTEPLSPNDPRNVPLDELGSPNARVRGEAWVKKLAKAIAFSEKPALELFTGLSGSGKSTELRRLMNEFVTGNYGLHPILIDASEGLDLYSPIDVSDLMIMIVNQVERAVLVLEQRDPEESLKTGYPTRLWSWLTRTDVELTKAEFKVSEKFGLSTELKTRPALRARIRQVVNANIQTFLSDVQQELQLLQERAIKATGTMGLVVIVDSLEKMDGTGNTYQQVREMAGRLFVQQREMLQLPFHVVYTIPSYVLTQAPSLQVRFIPMIKMHDRKGGSYQPGLDAAKEIILKRIPATDLPSILGPGWSASLDVIVNASGGYPREFIRIMRELLLEDLPIDLHGVQRCINRIADVYERAVFTDDYPWLAQVHAEKALLLQNPEHQKSAERLLAQNLVLRYVNDNDWFDPHPLVLRIPGVQLELQKLRAAAPIQPNVG